MKPLFYLIFKTCRYFVMWSHDLHSKSIGKNKYVTGSKTFEVISDIFLFIYTRVERFGIRVGWLIREPYYVDKAIKNSEERLKNLEKMKAAHILIDTEKKILTKRRWIQNQGFKTMEEWYAINPKNTNNF